MSLYRFVRESVVVLLCLAILIYFTSKGMFVFSLFIILLLFVLLKFLSDTSLAFLVIFAVGAFELKLPFYPSNMPNELPFVMLYVITATARFTIKKSTDIKHRLTTIQKCSLFVLIFNLILLAIVRSNLFSTMNMSTFWYPVIALSTAVFMLSRDERLNVKRMKGLVCFIVGATFIRALIQYAMVVTGTKLIWLQGYMDISTESSLREITFGQRHLINRFNVFNEVARSITFFALRYIKLHRNLLAYITFSLAATFAILSSYRYGLFMITVCFAIYILLFIQRKTHTICSALLFATFALALLYAAAPILPFQIQRSISFLPGINVPYTAKASATGTIAWRIDLWTYTLDHMNNYLLFGRGLTRDYASALALNTWEQNRYFYILCYHLHAYHSSLIGLFIDLGIIGAISFIVFIWATLRELYRGIKGLKQNAFLTIFMQYYFCFYIARLLVSTASGYNVDEMLYDAFINLSFMHVMTWSLADDQVIKEAAV